MSAVEVHAAVRSAGRRLVLPRVALAAVLWTFGGFLLGVCMAVTLPFLFGFKSLTVLSGSMEPTIHVGDIVVVREISPLQVRVGDIVTFRDPGDPDRLVTHRLRKIEVSGTTVKMQTKGDANTSVEDWKVAAEGRIGEVVYRVPRLGYLLFWVRAPIGRLLLVVLPALLLGGYELWRIWSPATPHERGEGDAA